MSIPISGLDVATVINDNDLLLIRQNLVDKQAFASLMRTINIGSLTQLVSPQSDDEFIIARTGTNYRVRYDAVSFPSGTIMWFYQSTPPSGWDFSDTTSGALLAVKGPGGADPGPGSYSTPGTVQGDWQQLGTTLTLQQIPPHRHSFQVSNDSGSSTTRAARARTEISNAGFMNTLDSGGDQGVTQPHNHGALWRPTAHIGILCKKR